MKGLIKVTITWMIWHVYTMKTCFTVHLVVIIQECHYTCIYTCALINEINPFFNWIQVLFFFPLRMDGIKDTDIMTVCSPTLDITHTHTHTHTHQHTHTPTHPCTHIHTDMGLIWVCEWICLEIKLKQQSMENVNSKRFSNI